jgi:hypothetical protein
MANLTMISGRINAMQEYNLKIYPLVFFNGVSSVKIDYDFSSNNKVEYEQNKSTLDTTFKIENKFTPKVEYFIELEEAQNDLLNKRFEHLEKSVRAIFWQDTKIMIYFNNKLVFESGKNVGK